MKTGIICTLGPASQTESIVRAMAREGMSIARMNFSHGTHDEHLSRIKLVRQVNRKYGFRVKVLLDLEGYRIRVGDLPGKKPMLLEKGEVVSFVKGKAMPKGKALPMDYSGDITDFRGLQFLFIDDGRVCLEIQKVSSGSIRTKVVVGGVVSGHKGINVPGVRIPLEGLTPKDSRDVLFGIENKVDYIAQSFVRKARDMQVLRDAVKEKHPRCRLIAKIENEQGIANIDSIIKASDGIMVARGDLGVSMPIYEVPVFQKMIIEKCNRVGKMDITATQMLETMVDSIRPSRAEVSDIANAVLDGSDYLMLSGETAKGRYPVEAVHMMKRTIEYTERSSVYRKRQGALKGA